MSGSLPFLTPSVHVGALQVIVEPQTLLWQSASRLHFLPSAQAAHGEPPQSVSVSVPFLSPSSQAGARQLPAPSHFWWVPQAEPIGRGAPSTHVAAPLAQAMEPATQAVGLVVQAMPCAQSTHEPSPSQMRPEPQAVPAEAWVPSTHPGVAPHCCVPSVQGAPGFPLQESPASHGCSID
jgi:hypothetical protein